MDGSCSTYGERRDVYRVLLGKPEGKRSLGIPRRRWEDNIKMDLQEVGWGSMDWIDVAQDRGRSRSLCECSSEPWDSIICKGIS
jgi:hypothetical protein